MASMLMLKGIDVKAYALDVDFQTKLNMSGFTRAANGVVLFKGRIYAPNDTMSIVFFFFWYNNVYCFNKER